MRRVTPALTILIVQKVDRTFRENIHGGGYHSCRPEHGNFYVSLICSFSHFFSLCFRSVKVMQSMRRHRTVSLSLGKATLANFTCTTYLISDRATYWLYSFIPSATAALLPNLPWKERPRELGSFLFGNLLGNSPSSSVPGEPETILGVRMHAPFPREYYPTASSQSFFGRSG